MLGWERRPAQESPRLRRLRNDLSALEQLQAESSVVRFKASGKPAQQYTIEFRGRSLARIRGKVTVAERHEVEIKLGASYPRSMPELRWVSPIYHPNISEIGMVCLGGYGTHWVPGLNLDELVGMLWDMARYHNYDVRSPYNRDAALWVAHQTNFAFPTDHRPIRDLRAALGRIEGPSRPEEVSTSSRPQPKAEPTNVVKSAPVAADSGPDGLIILDDDGDPIPLTDFDRPIRLRSQDEEIVFIE